MRSALGGPALLVSLVTTLAASGMAAAQSPEPSPDIAAASAAPGVAHPIGSTDVVLRMDTTGGLVPLTYAQAHAPEFTLYGDGTVIFRATDDPEGDGFPPFVQAHMDASQSDALLLEALDMGGLREARESYDQRQATDLPTTVFSIAADGVDKAVAVLGLGMTTPDGPDAEEYERFEQLGVKLVTFGELGEAGLYQDPQPYQPTGYRAFLAPAVDPTTDAIPWPWAELTLADFALFGDLEDVRLGGLTPEQAGAVTTVPSGGVPSLVIEGPDGIAYSLTIRPLLPGDALDPTAQVVTPSPTS